MRKFGKCGCVLPGGARGGAYQVGVLKAVVEYAGKVDVLVAASGVGALNAWLARSTGVEALERAWLEGRLSLGFHLFRLVQVAVCFTSYVLEFPGAMIFQLVRVGVDLDVFKMDLRGGRKLSLYGLLICAVFLIVAGAIVVVAENLVCVAVFFAFPAAVCLSANVCAEGVLRCMLRECRRYEVVSGAACLAKQGVGQVLVVGSEKVWLFDPLDPEYYCLATTPSRWGVPLLAGSSREVFQGNVRRAWVPVYRKIEEMDCDGSSHSALACVSSLILHAFDLDEIPFKPAIDAGCQVIVVADLSVGSSREDFGEKFDKYVIESDRRVRLMQVDPFDLVTRYNKMLAKEGAAHPWGSPGYWKIGKSLLDEVGVGEGSGVHGIESLLLGSGGEVWKWWSGYIPTQSSKRNLIDAGYRDMRNALGRDY